MIHHPLELKPLAQRHIDFLLSKGISTTAMNNPSRILLATGTRHEDGRFDPDPEGQTWLAFEERDDRVFWQPRTGELATDQGRSFALGEDKIANPWTYAFEGWLKAYSTPLEWLQNDRDGVVIIDWRWAYEYLQDVPRIAVCPSLIATARKRIRPRHLPQLGVLQIAGRIAA